LHHLVHRHHLPAPLLLLARFGGLLSRHERGERKRQYEAYDGHHLDLFQFHSPPYTTLTLQRLAQREEVCRAD